MSHSTGSLAAARRRPPAAEPTLPRADEALRLPPPALRRERWRGGRRWPFGPIPTAVSVVLHAVALVVILWALAAPPPPAGVGERILVAMTPELCDVEDCTLLDTPDELPVLEPLEIPLPELEAVAEEELELEELVELAALPRESALTLDIVSRRLPTKEPVRTETPPVRVTLPAPPPQPRVSPPPRTREPAPRGRLRPIWRPITYPDAARRAGIQGRARVQMTIDANGNVVDARLLASSGFAVLDRAAVASARQWRFAPPGTPRRAAQTFRFTL